MRINPPVLGCVVLIFAKTWGLDDFRDLVDMSHFTRVSEVKVCHFRADLVFDLNLTEITRAVDTTCKLVNHLWNQTKHPTHPEHLKGYAEMICLEDRARTASVIDFLTGTNARNPRFLGAILASLVSGVSGLLFGEAWGASGADQALKRNQDRIWKELAAEEHRGSLDHKALQHLAAVVAQDEELQLMTNHGFEASLALLALFQWQDRRVGTLLQALEDLISRHRLPPALIKADVLAAKLKEMQEELEPLGRELAATSELDLFECPVSFTTGQDFTLKIAVHVPVLNKGDVFTLYRYLPIPMPHGQEWRQVDVQDAVMAVDSTKTRFFAPSSWDMAECLTFKQGRVCSNSQGVDKIPTQSCWVGLLTADREMVEANCALRVPRDQPDFWMLDHEQVVLFHDKPRTASLRCGAQTRDSLHFAGLRLIQIPLGCRVENDFFEVYGKTFIMEEHAILRMAPVNVSGFETPQGRRIPAEALATELAGRVVHDPDLPPLEPLPPSYGRWALFLGGVTLTVVVILICALGSRFQWLRRRTDDGEIIQELPRHEGQ